MRKVTLKLTNRQVIAIVLGLNEVIDKSTGSEAEELTDLREYIRGAFESAKVITYKRDFETQKEDD